MKAEISAASRASGNLANGKVVLTGIGQRNAERAIAGVLNHEKPAVVLTCGFAGGLNPALETHTVVFSADDCFGLSSALLAAGARPAMFHCAERVATTAEEKHALWRRTGADAVEMESGVIRRLCREAGVPSATVRVISDAANENLPLDFNQLMDSEQNLRYGKLLMALLKSPGKIGRVVKLQKETKAMAERLSDVLIKVVSDPELIRSMAG